MKLGDLLNFFFELQGYSWGLIAIAGGDPSRARENLEELRPCTQLCDKNKVPGAIARLKS